MSFRFSVLVASVLVFVVVAVDTAAKKKCKSEITEHIAEKENSSKWYIDPPQDIHGDNMTRSIVWTWKKQEVEGAINEQINRELYAHYTYLSMTVHFSRDDNYLPGFAKFFKEAAEEEHKHAMMFMEYQNRRGGRVKLHAIKEPCRDQWGNGTSAMKDALSLERTIYNNLKDLLEVAEKDHDHQMMDFIATNFLNEQIESISLLGKHIGSLQRLDTVLGEYQFDKLTLGGK